MILVTGGCGYIGSHTVVELAKAGEKEIVIADNLSNSKKDVLERIKEIVPVTLHFYQADIGAEADMERIFSEHPIDTVVHFAGLKAVGESVAKPILYYENNVAGTLCLLKVMALHGCKNIIFSSSLQKFNFFSINHLTFDRNLCKLRLL